MSDRIVRSALAGLVIAMAVASGACAVGPTYHRPETAPVETFHEAPPAGWSAAQPNDAIARGAWWEIFGDGQLNALASKVSITNQNVLAAEAQFRAAKAAVGITRSGLFPAVTAGVSATRTGGDAASGLRRSVDIPVDASYQADVWGSIRRSVRSDRALAQASAADLENARLLYQSELAADYFQIQGLDAEQRLLQQTVTSFEQYLQLTKDRFEGGVVSLGDVALAQTQLESTRAQLVDLGVARAQFEHAIAVLTGQPPSALTITAAASQSPPPAMPAILPSTLLERRPDIAAAERQVASANELIGVAKAAFFPTLVFSGTATSNAERIADLFTAPTRLWSIGAQLAGVIFDGGKRRAQVKVSEATYDATVAAYRQTVLTAFQQVEDALAEARILADEAVITDRAIAAAQQSLDISTTQYRGGLTNYLQVITAQTNLLQNQRTAVTLRTRQLVASVALMQAIGGGWNTSQPPFAPDRSRS